MLTVNSLGCVRGERLVFENLSFSLEPGAALIVTGANGSGKSSLLRIAAGLLQPEAGTIEGTASIAYLGHLDGLKAVETPRESVAFRARLHGSREENGALAAMGLEALADMRQRYLSAGQKRRAALAGIIAGGARVWLLDEPTAALDADGKVLLLAAIARHRGQGGAVLITTHEALEIEGAESLSLSGLPNLSSSGEPLDEAWGSIGKTFEKNPMDPGPAPHWSAKRLVRDDVKRGVVLTILLRDLRLAARQGGQITTTSLFFLLVVMVLALGVGPDPAGLRALAPGAVWTAVLLASLLSLHSVFTADAEDGSLDQLRAGQVSPEALAVMKISAHFLTTGVPLALLTPLVVFFLELPYSVLPVMALSVLLGSATLSLIGGAIAALLIGARRGGLLSALLTLPLYVPVLIFGAGAVENSLAGMPPTHPLLLLAALLALALPLAPIAAAAALEE